ncbi:anaerobic ribonucleoside-triphosphate reductase activating protein [Thalassomonas actiniarum]|uniref:Anaerobic ribonucleoside-triphosphate reductase activating protein n=1 Tax=Thalassomonas actiniarum TaxID=485447 RepID=A0AAF0C1E4_9GAMM|nr:anaerobic ribonucleoside-triphosphate reductase activating protein [Thalassomonas actiniarum]WDD97342.1 anaerobic ribonucleoside-triphosphate reductase activating protein [Thalassomonas actiniarum]
MPFNCLTPTIVFQEVPGEISLCFSITGCKLACRGCHSTELWNENNGQDLNKDTFCRYLDQYAGLLSCIVFFGGEWQAPELIEKLKIARAQGLKTCLYSGQEHIDISISQHLTYLKTGKWTPKRGGLDNPATNQVFFDLTTGKKLNHLFVKSASNNSAGLTLLTKTPLKTKILQQKGNLHAAA